MASDTATRTRPLFGRWSGPEDDTRVHRRWRRAGRAVTGLTVRILSVNLAPILILALGILYLGQYKDSLVKAELETMKAQAQLFAGAIAEGAVRPVVSAESQIFRDPSDTDDLVPELSRRMVRRLGETTESRTRLLDRNGELVGDSQQLVGPGGVVQMVSLDPPEEKFSIADTFHDFGKWLVALLPLNINLPKFPGNLSEQVRLYPDTQQALEGNISASAWKTPDNRMILIAAAPVQKIKQVLGVVLLTHDGTNIEKAINDVRAGIVKVFFAALGMTVLLSLYLSSVIARPLKRLAVAAEAVRVGKGRATQIPDLSKRRDEIGELSLALREMTQGLWDRMDAVEHFAADVAHEIKNPLTSVRSAVETAAKIKDQDKRDRLMEIVLHDVQRLDRLISDISSASRLDAELSREEMGRVDLSRLLSQLIDIYRRPLERADDRKDSSKADSGSHDIALDMPSVPVVVMGSEGRLVQVFQNLISNALSFSPSEGIVTIRVLPEPRHTVRIEVEDQGPGIPENKIETIFDRFYTERPQHEAYGSHSGLGLSIARQIIDAHGGRIYAENISAEGDGRRGARFAVILNAG